MLMCGNKIMIIDIDKQANFYIFMNKHGTNVTYIHRRFEHTHACKNAKRHH